MKIVLLPFFVGFIVLSDEGPETFVWVNPKGSERFMVQDQVRDVSTSWQGKTCIRRSWISRKISRELLRLRNSWKISSQIISWFQRIQMEIIMIKTIQEYCLVFLWSRNRHGRSPFRWRNSHAGNPWGFFTRSRLDHDGILAEDTLDRPFVVYESLLVSHQGDLDIPV